jgi:hypothetical protein
MQENCYERLYEIKAVMNFKLNINNFLGDEKC